MPVLYTPHFVQFFDDNGDPLSGGKLYTYAAGTSTLKATYTTAAGTIENTNPIVLDAAGRAALFISGSYKFTLTDSNDVLVRTTDNIIAFTATGEASSAYFEAFSGDGSTTVFTTSEDLGTDEKLIMVYVDNGLQEHGTNGTFATDTGWTKGAGWTIGSGVATAAGALSTAISQSAGVTINAGQPYVVTMTITRDAGSLTPSVGGTAGTARSSAGTYSEIIIAGSTQTLAFTGAGFTGTLDNVTVKPAASAGFNLLSTSGYTISGTTLTLASTPATGTNNIQVWAPALNAAAAAASAESAAASASAAAASATLAATVSAGTSDVSTTSLAIETGPKTFTVTAGKSFTAGMYLTATDQADSANYMQGFVTSYSGTTLIMTIQSVGGSGTISAWNIYPSATYLSFIASQAEAEAGTSSTKLMSPQRTAQAIAAIGSGLWSVSSSGTASAVNAINFTGLTKTTCLVIRMDTPSGSNAPCLVTSTNGGSTYDSGASDYAYSYVSIGSSISNVFDNENTSIIIFGGSPPADGSGAMYFTITIYDPENTSFNKIVETEGCFFSSSSQKVYSFKGSGARLSIGDIDAVRIFLSGGSATANWEYTVLEQTT